MKATAMTKALAACAALALFAGTALAAAIPSPVGTTLSPRSDNVGSVRSVRSLDQETHDELLDTAADVLELEYGTGQTIESLLGVTVMVESTDGEHVTVAINVAGARVGDHIVIFYRHTDGTTGYVEGRVISDGVVEATLPAECDIVILRLVDEDADNRAAASRLSTAARRRTLGTSVQ